MPAVQLDVFRGENMKYLLIFLILITAGDAAATARLHPNGSTGVDVHGGKYLATYGDQWEWGGGFTYRGRVSAELVKIESERRWRDWWVGSIMVCPVRSGGTGLEIGYERPFRSGELDDTQMIPVRAFQRVSLPADLRLVPHATVTFILDRDHDNEFVDLGLDLLWRRWRLAAEWLANEDFRYHPLTLRFGGVHEF